MYIIRQIICEWTPSHDEWQGKYLTYFNSYYPFCHICSFFYLPCFSVVLLSCQENRFIFIILFYFSFKKVNGSYKLWLSWQYNSATFLWQWMFWAGFAELYWAGNRQIWQHNCWKYSQNSSQNNICLDMSRKTAERSGNECSACLEQITELELTFIRV